MIPLSFPIIAERSHPNTGARKAPLSFRDPMSPDQHEASRRGRRSTDWTLRRIIEIGTVIGLLWAGFNFISAATAARWATHNEVTDAVKPVVDTLNAFKATANARLLRVEIGQQQAEAVHQLLVPLARLSCLDLARQRSSSLAAAAGLPCDSLLRRMR